MHAAIIFAQKNAKMLVIFLILFKKTTVELSRRETHGEMEKHWKRLTKIKYKRNDPVPFPRNHEKYIITSTFFKSGKALLTTTY